MARKTRQWHPAFMEYMKFIVNHPNYKGLMIEKSDDGSYNWIATAKSEIGKNRIRWALEKAHELGIQNVPGVYADVMLAIHPTKNKVCQICGRSMSLFYHYPGTNFIKLLKNTFGYDFTQCDHISDIWDILIENQVNELELKHFMVSRFGLPNETLKLDKEDIIEKCEYVCRKGNKKYLSPGAMSNFPDRYDGFHTYNRCCRATQDTGRFAENLKSYTKDRRAYEYWSDGNLHAANMFMGSGFFDGKSADHIGPISLGFVHDPRYLQPMGGGDNSAKRDRLQVEDIDHILAVEQRVNVYPMSWYSAEIWEYIKKNYRLNEDKVSTLYRDALKQNMVNFMTVLGVIIQICGNEGIDILDKAFLETKAHYFEYSYEFDNLGNIVKRLPRHYTGRNNGEMNRFVRIAVTAVLDFSEKENRHLGGTLTQEENRKLEAICGEIVRHEQVERVKKDIEKLMYDIQRRIIETM